MKKPRPLSTQLRIEKYEGKKAILETWEAQPEEIQIKNHDVLRELRQRVRQERGYILHRNDREATI